jgi:uncharacterized membrane protein
MIETLVVVGIVIMCTAWYMRRKWRRRRRAQGLAAPHYAALEVLATRYARGEINREEYLLKRDDILASCAQGLAVPHHTALEVLATRYAGGEIKREEYLQKRDDILASSYHATSSLTPRPA